MTALGDIEFQKMDGNTGASASTPATSCSS